MSSFRLTTWNADAIANKARAATKAGIDETTAAAVQVASDRAPRDTGHMADTLSFEPAVVEGSRIVGRWGNTVALYTLWVEIGSRGRPGRYFLRSAADMEYPKLAERIASYY